MTKQRDEGAHDFSREDFRVAGRLVRPRLGRIVFEGETVQVQPKIMELLVCLARHAGQVVTRAELVEEVWAGAHVTEHALARAVYELRKIFGDSAQRPRVVETIPKIGYRLIAPVTAERNGEGAADTEGDPARPVPDTASGAARAPAATATGFGVGSRRPSFPVLVAAALAFAALLFLLTLVLPGGGHRARHFINHSIRH
jgi:DNA-binding winged helix-turn-helix (wHTH) protein